jgi:TRAP-type C4-dicarboxylate transport system permease small subunit
LGTTELTEMMMICIGFLGLAYCAKEDAHLKVDILIQHLSRRAQVAVDAVIGCIGIVVVGLISWLAFIEAAAMKEMDISGSLLLIPVYPFYCVLGFGCLLLCISIFTQIITSLSKDVR